MLKQLSFFLLAVGLITATAVGAPIVIDPSFDLSANTYGPIVGWDQSPFPSGNPGFIGGYLTGSNVQGASWDNGSNGEGPTGRVAFIQDFGPFGNEVMSLQQNVLGFDNGVSYTLSYQENARAGTSAPNLEVFVNGVSVVANHLDTAVTGGGDYSVPFRVVTSSVFTIPGGGSALVEFRASNVSFGADSSALIDNVSITAVPEPASLVLGGLGAVGLLLAARRRKA